ncbi:MAG: type IX secretion system sortase PorU [Chitinophagales bacterium]|nr:type IX secretion system sortase PorU [Chitinophagales bacterium]
MMPFRSFICLIFLIITFIVRGGNTNISLQWEQQNTLSTSKTLMSFTNAVQQPVEDFIPYYIKDIKASFLVSEPILTNVSVQVLNITLPESWKGKIGSTFKINLASGKEKNQYIHTFSILPIRLNASGQYEFLTNGTLEYKEETINHRLGNRSYAANSVLASGNWYKFGVTKSGLYKLDYDFLKSLGMNPDNINPAQIKIYGHDGGMLPQLAGSAVIDDIKEYGIKVVTSGVNFKSGDYILFYAPGPEEWIYNSANQTFRHQVHYYAATKNFFITADGATGQRIGAATLSTDGAVATLTTYDDFAFKEDELTNLGRSGIRWFGEEFGFEDQRTYNFSFPDIDNSASAKINSSFAARSSSFSTSFSVAGNGTNLATYNIGPVGSSTLADYGRSSGGTASLANPSDNISVTVTYSRPDFDSRGWLDYIEIQVKRKLIYRNTPLYFRGIATSGSNTYQFEVSNMSSSVEIWDITDVFNPKKVNYALAGGTASFKMTLNGVHEFVALENSSLTPTALGKVENQNLHGLPQADMIIIARKNTMAKAQELANFHAEKQGLTTHVIDLERVFNEFSSGTNDMTAIRDFVKMFYDRAGGNTSLMPKYLLLFGDGTYNNRNLGAYYIPSYQSPWSLELLKTYTSDDYFALLDDSEGDNIDNTTTQKLDIAVGRIPADNDEKASIAVAKIKKYMSSEGFGDWRNQFTLVSDDEDGILHEDAADGVAQIIKTTEPTINVDKIYLDAFVQTSGAGGSTYPEVNDAINKKMFTGSLFMNYVGHGGVFGWAKERVLTFDDINTWENEDKLPLFITATCEFGPYDQEGEYTAGERVYFSEKGGAIALLTTVRLVYSDRNEEINRNFVTKLLEANNAGTVVLGDVLTASKNITFTADGNRKFTLLGDPALIIGFPQHNIATTAINMTPVTEPLDTIKALSKVKIEGAVQNKSGNLLSGFNGIVEVRMYDKAKTINTLENDEESGPFTFSLQKNVLFNGRAQVSNGLFSVEFLIPKDIDYTFGAGKLSYYANDADEDAGGFFNDFIIGGISDTIINDNEGPIVELFMEDESFIFGGLTSESPNLFAKLFDENGINTSGNGIGHDITAIIDEETSNTIVLNDFFKGNLGDFTKGEILYPFSQLSPGRHTLTLKAWDNLNNSGKGYTEFVVAESEEFAINNLLNYPNPFSTHTEFTFEHNRAGSNLDVRIEVYAVSGRLVKTLTSNGVASGYRFNEISWDGLDDYGDKLARGVYIYKVTVSDDEGNTVKKLEKLVILR